MAYDGWHRISDRANGMRTADRRLWYSIQAPGRREGGGIITQSHHIHNPNLPRKSSHFTSTLPEQSHVHDNQQ